MNVSFLPLCAFCAVLTCGLPCAQLRSQALAPSDPTTALQTLQTTNDELIKRQETTLKELTDMTTEAREIKVFSKRG